MRDLDIRWAAPLIVALVATSGCINALELQQTQSYAQRAVVRQQADLSKLTYGELCQDRPLVDIGDWQSAVSRSAAGRDMESFRTIIDKSTRTMVVFVDLRPDMRGDDHQGAGQYEQAHDSDELYAKYGVDASAIREEEIGRRAFGLRIFQTYPDARGYRRVEKYVLLPRKSDVNEVNFEGSPKYRAKWRTVLHDPYVALYPIFASGLYVRPDINDIREHAVEWVFHRGFEETWRGAVYVAAQHQGILLLEGDSKKGVMVCRRTMPIRQGKEQCRYETILLIIAVVAETNNLTRVCCAPMTREGAPQPLVQRSLLSFPYRTIGSQSVDSTNYLSGLEVVRSRLSAESGLAGNGNDEKKDDSESERTHRRAISIHRFFQEMSCQFFLPEMLVEKYARQPDRSFPNSGMATLAKFQPQTTVPEYYAATASHYGQQASNYLCMSQVQIADQKAQQMLQSITEEIIRTIPEAASALPATVRVRILASPDVQAFVLPNGDIFVCSGLLDILDDRGELAAVLGHELCHLVSRDAGGKMYSEEEARKFVAAVMYAAQIGAGIVGPLMSMGSVAAAGASNLGSQLGSSIASALIQGVSPVAAAMIAEAALEGYSQEAELQADRFAVTALIRTGYDPQSLVGVLTTLRDIEMKTSAGNMTDKRHVQSSLINAKPGLAKRMSKVKALLAQRL
jgi:hypothetical protein